MIAMPEVAQWLLLTAALAACVAIDGLFCGLESGVYVLNKIRLELRAEAGISSAKFLRRMLARPNNMLAVLLIGTNSFRYVATFCITSMFVLGGYEKHAEWLTLAVATPAFFVLTDASPKNIFRSAAEALVYRTAWLLRAANLAFNAAGLAPLVRGIAAAGLRLTGASRRGAASPLWHEDINAAIAEGHASGVLTMFQSNMANRLVQIKELALTDVMRPLRQAVSAPLNVTREQFLQIVAKHEYSRLPLLDADGQVVAVLDVYDVLSDPSVAVPADKAAAALVLPEDMGIIDALYRLQHQRQAMGIVANDKGKHIGLLTVKDLVEEIVGELENW